MDNKLIQVNGRKRIVLYNPKDAVYLYLNGESACSASDTARNVCFAFLNMESVWQQVQVLPPATFEVVSSSIGILYVLET